MAFPDIATIVATVWKKAVAYRGYVVRTTATSVLANDPVLFAQTAAPAQADNNADGSLQIATDTGALRQRSDGTYKAMASTSKLCALHEDFIGDTGGTLPAEWAKDMQTANITGDYVSGQGAGVYRILTDATSEAQAGQITGGDALHINMSKNPVFEARVRVAPAGADFTADERLVVGLCSAHATAEAALDDVVTNAWFRIEGGGALAILAETDDGTTDDDDNDTSIVLVKSAWTVFTIDCSDLSNVKFYVDGVLGATLDMTDLGADTYVQPIVCLQRDAGTEANSLDIDYIHIDVDR